MTDRKARDFRDIFLLYILCGVLFCFFNQHFTEKGIHTKPEKNEYVSAFHHPAISEKQELKISKPLHASFLLQSIKENQKNQTPQVQSTAKSFSLIKILLKQSSYN